MNIGEEIRKQLDRKHISVTEFSQMLHYSRTGVYKLLAKESIDTNLLLRISVMLDYDFFLNYSTYLVLHKGDSEAMRGGESSDIQVITEHTAKQEREN